MGNEASHSTKVGTPLENDCKVTWKKSTAECPFAAREGHCACSVGQKLVVFGGATQAEDEDNIESNELLVYDQDEQKWTKPETNGNIPAARSSATIAAVNKKLYLFGGLSRNTGWLEDVHIYDTETNVWSKADVQGEGPSPRDKLSSTVIKDKIYIFGGFGPQMPEEEEVEEFSDGDEISEDAPQDQEAAQFGWFDDLFIFDPLTLSWSQPMQMNLGCPSARAAHGMAAVQDKYLVIFGGRDAEARKNDLYIFDTEMRKWVTELQAKGCAPEPRSFHTLTTVDNRVVVIGGRGVNNQHFQDIHYFDTETYEWLQPALEGNVPAGRGCHTATVVGDQLLVYGGSSHFSTDIMQCTCFHNDLFSMSTAEILSGSSKQDTANESSSVLHLEGSSERASAAAKRPVSVTENPEESATEAKRSKADSSKDEASTKHVTT